MYPSMENVRILPPNKTPNESRSGKDIPCGRYERKALMILQPLPSDALAQKPMFDLCLLIFTKKCGLKGQKCEFVTAFYQLTEIWNNPCLDKRFTNAEITNI
jgi:hypothetical protein